jgi:hypothetical protein
MKLAETLGVATTAAELEEATFALLGAWVPTVPEPAVRVLLAEQALHHAWHASLWRAVVPVAVGLEPAAGGDVGLRPAFELVRSLTGDDPVGSVGRLTGAHVTLADARLAAYRALWAAVSTASDGPILRTLSLVIDDQERDRRAGLALLASLRSLPDDGLPDAGAARG